jgi:thiamine-phosphate diphosphorylase
MRLPRLHVVTDDAVLADPAFAERADEVFAAGGLDIALHLRGHRTSVRERYRIAERLAASALRTGAWLFINDRIDIAMAVRANGVQLGVRSLPVPDARSVIGAGARIGFSAHDTPRAVEAVVDGADFVLLGTIFPSASHPGRDGAGTAALQDCASRAGVPVVGIGGFTPQRAREAAEAGAYGIAVLDGIWGANDVATATATYVGAVADAWAGRRQEQEK